MRIFVNCQLEEGEYHHTLKHELYHSVAVEIMDCVSNRYLTRDSLGDLAENIPTLEELVQRAKALFKLTFRNKDPNIVVFAPGRVNLIGEHVDYCDGIVLPVALPLVTVMVGTEIEGDETTIITDCPQADDPKKAIIGQTPLPGTPKWANYIKGVMANYKKKLNKSFEAAFTSSIPVGEGLSSSSSLEVATHIFLDALTKNKKISSLEKALTCQKAEHEYAKVRCSIMDQFVSVMGKKDNALLIDCRTLKAKLIPMTEPEVFIVITNSNVKHKLSGTEYATRQEECQQAAALLNLKSLRDADMESIKILQRMKRASPEIIKRARHVISEIKRTAEASEMLLHGDYETFGRLMVQSHNSLRDNFEVSTPELDKLVTLALEVQDVYGSRMTGVGFGGCTVTLAKKNCLPTLVQHIQEGYENTASIYICTASDGAKILESD